MHFDIISLFPEMFTALRCGITGRAQENKLITLQCYNPRDYTTDNYSKVDDSPYGGGPGMVMLCEPLRLAIQAAKSVKHTQDKTIYLSPQGKKLDQQLIQELLPNERLILVAGRYEGIDERIIAKEVDLQISIGDYVISGGELAAMVLIDAITRQIPGALGDLMSATEDSFVDGLFDYPHYTRPEIIFGMSVPKVLLSGNHEAITRWRRKQALGRTWLARPDLLAKCQLTAMDTMLLNEFVEELNRGKL